MFSKSFKVVTHSSRCDLKPPFVGSSIEAPVLNSTGASLTEKSLTLCVAGSGNLAMSASSSIAALHTCESGAGHGCSSSFERSSTLRVPVPGSASALRSTNMNGAGGPMYVDHGLSSSKRMSQRFAGSSALRSKNMDGAGGPMCVGHGLRSSRSTSRSFAGSSTLKGKVVDGKAWNCKQSSDFEDFCPVHVSITACPSCLLCGAVVIFTGHTRHAWRHEFMRVCAWWWCA